MVSHKLTALCVFEMAVGANCTVDRYYFCPISCVVSGAGYLRVALRVVGGGPREVTLHLGLC